tara:strand:- start:1371 stop:1745 length:375 start_codon:yes stop_codon:yes gene_type:complete
MHLKKIIKFSTSGIFNSFLNIAVVTLLLNFGFNAYFSSATGFFSGSISGYFLNFFWTFENKNCLGIKLIKYILLQVVTLLVGISIFSLCYYYLSITTLLSQLAGIIITAMLNFTVSNYFIFLKK